MVNFDLRNEDFKPVYGLYYVLGGLFYCTVSLRCVECFAFTWINSGRIDEWDYVLLNARLE